MPSQGQSSPVTTSYQGLPNRATNTDFRDLWLLTDLDGTLVPTPHKAGGHYVKLAKAPTGPAVTEWTVRGGNLCIVTTADLRAIAQVYLSLRDSIIACRRRLGCRCFAPESAASQDVACDWCRRFDVVLCDDSLAASPGLQGQLLFALYTGAVLYHAVPRPWIKTESLTRDDIRQEIQEVAGYTTECGSCIDDDTASSVCSFLLDMFFEFLLQVVVEGDMKPLLHMSRRYQTLWLEMLKDVFEVCGSPEGCPTPPSANGKSIATSLSATSPAFAAGKVPIDAELAGPVSHNAAEELSKFPILQYSLEQRKMALNAFKSDHRLLRVIVSKRRIDPAPESAQGKECQSSPRGDQGIAHASAQTEGSAARLKQKKNKGPIVQILLVGVPMFKSKHLLGSRADSFERLGVKAIAQPNSVVVSHACVHKGITVEYLSKSHQLLKQKALQSAAPPPRAPRRIGQFQGCVLLDRAVALGDTPQAGDKELTQYPELHFISLQKDAQHALSLGHLVRTITQGVTGQQAAVSAVGSVVGATAPQPHSAPVSTMANVLYVGDEEVGGARFLTGLVKALNGGPAPTSHSGSNSNGGRRDTEVGVGRLSVSPSVAPALFHRAIHDAATNAKKSSNGGFLARL